MPHFLSCEFYGDEGVTSQVYNFCKDYHIHIKDVRICSIINAVQSDVNVSDIGCIFFLRQGF